MKSADSRGVVNWHKAEAKALRTAPKKSKIAENTAGSLPNKKGRQL